MPHFWPFRYAIACLRFLTPAVILRSILVVRNIQTSNVLILPVFEIIALKPISSYLLFLHGLNIFRIM